VRLAKNSKSMPRCWHLWLKPFKYNFPVYSNIADVTKIIRLRPDRAVCYHESVSTAASLSCTNCDSNCSRLGCKPTMHGASSPRAPALVHADEAALNDRHSSASQRLFDWWREHSVYLTQRATGGITLVICIGCIHCSCRRRRHRTNCA